MNVAVAPILYDEQNETIILVRRGPEARTDVGMWQFPGGAVDLEDATMAHALVRETKEELGIEINPTGARVIDIVQERYPEEVWVVLFYLVTTWSGKLTLLEPHKIDAIQEVGIEFIPEFRSKNHGLISRGTEHVLRTLEIRHFNKASGLRLGEAHQPLIPETVWIGDSDE